MPALQAPNEAPKARHARRSSAPAESFLTRKRPVIWFVVKFLAAVSLFYLLSLAPLCQRLQSAYLLAVASWAHAGLHAAGVDCHLLEETIWSGKCSVTVGPQCSGIELAWFLGAGMLAFPASWGRRAIGIAAGLIFMGALNIVRVATLYLVGVHAPAHFAWVHESGWPSLLILATLGVMGGWLGQLREQETPGNAPAH